MLTNLSSIKTHKHDATGKWFCIFATHEISQSYPPLKRDKELAWDTLRHGDLLPLVIEGRMEGRMPPRRPRTGILDRIKNGSSYQSFKRRAMENERKL